MNDESMEMTWNWKGEKIFETKGLQIADKAPRIRMVSEILPTSMKGFNKWEKD